MTRVRTRSLVLSLATLAVLAAPVPAHATSVADFSVDDLVQYADAAVRVRVVGSRPVDAEHTRYTLEVADVLFGSVAGPVLDLELLRLVDGMPRLEPGDDVVVFLNFTNRIERIIGLKWGTYRLAHDEVFDHEWKPIGLRRESRAGTERQFLRPLREAVPALTYSALKTRVEEIRSGQRQSAEGTHGSERVELGRK